LSAKGREGRGSKAQSPKKKAKKHGLSLKQRLIKALVHPMRWRILTLMNEREWSPNELAEELVEGLSQVSYHVKVLKDFELIEMTKTEPRRGAVEHYYRAVERAYLPTEISKSLPQSGRDILANKVLEDIDQDLGTSIKSRKFYERDDHHVTWTPEFLDEVACAKASELADEFVARFIELGVDSKNRHAEGNGDGELIPVSAALLVFPSDHHKTASRGKRTAKNKRARKRKAG